MWRDREWGVRAFFAVMATLMAVGTIGVVHSCAVDHENHALVNKVWKGKKPVLPPAQYALLPVRKEGEGRFAASWGREVGEGDTLSLRGVSYWSFGMSPDGLWFFVRGDCSEMSVALVVINKIDYDEQHGMMGKWPSDRRTFKEGVKMRVVKIVPLH